MPYAVLFSTWALPTQPCSQSGKCRWFSCTTRSTITRLPSGSSTSHSGVFRDGVLGVGVGTAHPCTGALAALCRIPAPPEPFLSAYACASTRICAVYGLGRNTARHHILAHLRRLHNPASLNVSGPALTLLVRPRYSSIRSFLRIGASLVACTDCVQHLPLGFSLHKKVRRTPLNSSLITHLSSHTAAPCAASRRSSAATMSRRFTTNSATERGEARQEARERTDAWTHQAPSRRWRAATGGIPP